MSPKTPPSPKTNAQACKSMTGYAQARVQHNGWALRISLRSVNHRFLDLHLRLPEGFDAFEPLIRQAVRERLRRGHVDVTLHFDPAGPAAVQVNRALGETAMDPARLAQEAALLAERGDISEELARLRSHVEQFAKLLDGAGELGKKLDFLLQEMHREANTMLSKTPGVEAEGLAITSLGLEIKGEIEKLREQVQNVE